MSKMLNWIVNLVPEQYRADIAIKKVSFMVGKLAVAFLASSVVKSHVGSLDADKLTQVQAGTTMAAGALLEALHDWAKMKWPDCSWL